MDLQIQEIRNSIMEEVILKNYKLLQYVEKEMNQLKEDNTKLKEEIQLLKDDNTLLKKEINNLQTKFDNSGIESNILIGYTGLSNPVYYNYNFNKNCNSLAQFLSNCSQNNNICSCNILLTLSVFKQLTTYYSFDSLILEDLFIWSTRHGNVTSTDATRCLIEFADEKYNKLDFFGNSDIEKLLISRPIPQNNTVIRLKLSTLIKLINILNECNIKLILWGFELYLDENNKINYHQKINCDKWDKLYIDHNYIDRIYYPF
jgi:hypothetical protein